MSKNKTLNEAQKDFLKASAIEKKKLRVNLRAYLKKHKVNPKLIGGITGLMNMLEKMVVEHLGRYTKPSYPQCELTPIGAPLSGPVPNDPRKACTECNHYEIPIYKNTFFNKDLKRYYEKSAHCAKCDHKIMWLQRILFTPQDEQSQKDELKHIGESWIDKK